MSSTIRSFPILSLKSTTGWDFFRDNLMQFHACLHTSKNKNSQATSVGGYYSYHRKNIFRTELECGILFLQKFLNILEGNLLFICTDVFCATFPIVNSVVCMPFSNVGLVLWNVTDYAQLFIQLWHVVSRFSGYWGHHLVAKPIQYCLWFGSLPKPISGT